MADVNVNDFDETLDPSNKRLYIVSDDDDFKIPFDDFMKYAIKSNGNVVIGVGTNVINFSAAFPDTNYSLLIYDPNGIGVQVTTKTIAGFECESLGAGIIAYVAIKNF